MFSEKSTIHLKNSAYAAGYELLCLSINIFGSILIARTVGPMRFADYTIVCASVATLSILLRGYQPAIASAVALSNLDKQQPISGNRMRYGITILVLISGWVISIKFLSTFSQVDQVFYLYGTALIPAHALTIFISGVLQGLHNVQRWRMHVFFATASQIPFLIIGAKWHLELPYFILILTIPSVAYFYISSKYIKSSQAAIILLRPKINLKSSLLALLAASIAGTPLFFAKQLLGNQDLGQAVFFLSGLIVASNLGAMFGSFLLTDRITSHFSGVNNGMIMHVLHSIPCLAYGVTFALSGHWILEHLIGPDYSIDIPNDFIFLATLTTSIWSINFSIFEEFLLSMKTSIVFSLLIILGTETTLLIFTEMANFSFFILHLSIGLIVLLFNKKFLYQDK
jgi:hypothetical protein